MPVQVFAAQYWSEFKEAHAAHVVSAYKEQPPVFYCPEEQDAQAVQVPFIAAVQVPDPQYWP